MNKEQILYLKEKFNYTQNDINKLNKLLSIFDNYIFFNSCMVATREERYNNLRLRFNFKNYYFSISLQDNKTEYLLTEKLLSHINNVNSFCNHIEQILKNAELLNR